MSLNILDIAQNSVSAGASLTEILVHISLPEDKLYISVCDNGKGMTKAQRQSAEDPFFTTRTTRKVGLGIPFFKMAAEMSGGSFKLFSKEGTGTQVCANFVLSHIDRMPAGNLGDTLCALIHMNPTLDFVFTMSVETEKNTVFFSLDTRQIKKFLGGVEICEPNVHLWLCEFVSANCSVIYGLCPDL